MDTNARPGYCTNRRWNFCVLHRDSPRSDTVNDLPCAQPCPPPQNTTDQLRLVTTRWVGGTPLPPRLVWCTPSKSIEAWVLAALYQSDYLMISGGLECYATPELRLQSKPADGRLVSGGKKITRKFRARAHEIVASWPDVRNCCGEAERFSADFERLFTLSRISPYTNPSSPSHHKFAQTEGSFALS